jgi:phytoene dehydrogenase-like protein
MATSLSEQKGQYDAVVVGGSFAGLTAAARLGELGLRVAVIDAMPNPGGRVGGVQYKGCWLPLGQRDAINGIGDAAVPSFAGSPMMNMVVRVHNLPDPNVLEVSMADIVAGSAYGDWDINNTDLYRRYVEVFGRAGADIDLVAKEVQRLYGLLQQVSSDDAWNLVEVTIGSWLDRVNADSEARTVIINQLEATQASPGEEASLGRYVLGMHGLQGPDDVEAKFPKVADMADLPKGVTGLNQTNMTRLANLIEAQGGELWLGWKPVEIIVDESGYGSGRRGRVKGAVARNDANVVRVFEAPIVITDYFGWQLPQFLDERLLPDSFKKSAEATEPLGGDAIAWIGCAHRLPRVRATGEVENHAGWQRISWGVGPIKSYHGGFMWPSMYDPSAAPEGKHFLWAGLGHQGRFTRWSDAKASVDVIREYLYSYYSDLDECLEWSDYQWCAAPQILTWHLKPVHRHPIKVSTIEGLYVGSSSAEGMAGFVRQEVFAGLEAARIAYQEMVRSN